MGNKDYDTATDEIKIGKEGYMPEGSYFHSIYDEDLGEKAGKGSIVLATQGCIAAPSKSTKDKFYSQKKYRRENKKIPACFAHLTMGGCTDALQYTSDLQPVTDYHEAMMENIARMREGEPVWSFRDRPKSYRKLHVQSFRYVQQLRKFYGIDKKDRYERRILKSKITEHEEKLPTKLAIRLFALEKIDNDWFKGYLHPKTYDVIKQKAVKSLELADMRYEKGTGKDPEPIRKKALEYEVEALWAGN